jgi:hypothetical protein
MFYNVDTKILLALTCGKATLTFTTTPLYFPYSLEAGACAFFCDRACEREKFKSAEREGEKGRI